MIHSLSVALLDLLIILKRESAFELLDTYYLIKFPSSYYLVDK